MVEGGIQRRDSLRVQYDDQADTYRAKVDSENQSLVNAITSTVATATDTQFTELPTLFDTIDPDILDGLLTNKSHRSTDTEIAIEFHYAGCLVTADSHGNIIVRSNSMP